MVFAIAENQMQWMFNNYLQNRGWGAARSDAAGRFVCTVQEWQAKQGVSQKWSVFASKDGYRLVESEGHSLGNANEAAEIAVTLLRGGVVSGRVELEGGGAPANVAVTLTPITPPPPEGTRRGPVVERRRALHATADVTGAFELLGVEDGKYTLSVTHAEAKAEPREVTAGATGLRIVLRMSLSITGIVLGEDGKPLSAGAAQIAVVIPGAAGAKETRRFGMIRPSGHFRISHLDPGSYAIEVTPGQNGLGGFETTRVPQVAAGSTDVEIRLKSGPSITGRVLDPGGRPVVGAVVAALSLKPASPQRGVRSEGTAHVQGNNAPTDVTNGRGEFEIAGVGDEEVELLSVKAGHAPTTLRATPGQRGVTIRLEAGVRVEARILKVDGTPYANQWMNLLPSAPETQKRLQELQQRAGNAWNTIGGWSLTQGRTDGKGVLEIGGLLPGSYTVQIWSDEGVLPEHSLTPDGGRVTLQMHAPMTIRGRVVDMDNKPIVIEPGQHVWVQAFAGSRHVAGVSVGEDGYFEVKGLPDGDIRIQVYVSKNYKPATVTVRAGTQGARIVLEPIKPPEQPAK
jgi:uncharacterized protein (DUF2141 family)